jgi:hypothetical protein
VNLISHSAQTESEEKALRKTGGMFIGRAPHSSGKIRKLVGRGRTRLA